MSRGSRLRLLAISLAVCACGEQDRTPVEPPVASSPSLAKADVVGDAIRGLEAQLAAVPPADAEVESERLMGLVAMVAGQERRMRELAIEEIAVLGDACVSSLAQLARSLDATSGDREAAVQLLAAIDTERAADELLQLAENADEDWLRAHAAWRLGETSQDWIQPRLLLRFKYEVDHQTVIWLAKSLASFGNFTGVGVLHTVATTTSDEQQRASALARMQEIADDNGFEHAFELWLAWDTGHDLDVFRPGRTARFDLEVLRWIARFDEFQLRGVDDARFLLARLGPHGAALMGMALADDSRYIRVNTAQSLWRMGRRARPAELALVTLLGDSDAGPNAAEALGAIASPAAEASLTALLDERAGPAHRLAGARALGGFGVDPGVGDQTLAALRELLLSSAAELRQAAAESLAYLGHGDEVVDALLGFLVSREVEPATTERALRAWLVARDDSKALAAWDGLAFEPSEIVPYEERLAARQRRRAVVEDALR